jgi:hypothetical protein
VIMAEHYEEIIVVRSDSSELTRAKLDSSVFAVSRSHVSNLSSSVEHVYLLQNSLSSFEKNFSTRLKTSNRQPVTWTWI